MNYKWIGAVLIVGSCTGFGFSLAMNRLREIRLMNALCCILDDMVNELSYHLTPLPELVQKSVNKSPKLLSGVFTLFCSHLKRQILPDAACCMEAALAESQFDYQHTNRVLLALGNSLGRFDLSGQLRSLRSVQELCREELNQLRDDGASQLRSYRVLGMCAGVALAIFLF